MKRMKDVFDLPVTDKNLTHVANYTSLEDDAAIIHVINHVDNLADALADLLDAVVNRSSHDSINNQIIAAAKALGKYRGKK